MKYKTINDLSVGESALILSINCEGAMKRRLIDMGITPGSKLYYIKSPL